MYIIQFKCIAAAAAAKSFQSCPTVRPHRRQPTRFPVPGMLQAGTLGWVAISFSSAWKWKVKVKSLSHVRLFSTPWTAAHQAPPSLGFSRQEYWSGVPVPSPLSALICDLVAKLCPWLFNPMTCGLPGSSVHGISQTRITGLLCPPPGHFPSPRSEPVSCTGRRVLYHWATRKPVICIWSLFILPPVIPSHPAPTVDDLGADPRCLSSVKTSALRTLLVIYRVSVISQHTDELHYCQQFRGLACVCAPRSPRAGHVPLPCVCTLSLHVVSKLSGLS